MQPARGPHFPQLYQIRVREYLDDDCGAWFDPLTLAQEADGATTLTGPVRNQAELHGLLIKIRDVNLTQLSVLNQ